MVDSGPADLKICRFQTCRFGSNLPKNLCNCSSEVIAKHVQGWWVRRNGQLELVFSHSFNVFCRICRMGLSQLWLEREHLQNGNCSVVRYIGLSQHFFWTIDVLQKRQIGNTAHSCFLSPAHLFCPKQFKSALPVSFNIQSTACGKHLIKHIISLVDWSHSPLPGLGSRIQIPTQILS